MTARELAHLIGQRVLLPLGGLRVEVEIRDAREVFGRIDVLVSPVAGEGEVWKEFSPTGGVA